MHLEDRFGFLGIYMDTLRSYDETQEFAPGDSQEGLGWDHLELVRAQ